MSSKKQGRLHFQPMKKRFSFRRQCDRTAAFGRNAAGAKAVPGEIKKPVLSDWLMELMTGFEPVTSSLPMG